MLDVEILIWARWKNPTHNVEFLTWSCWQSITYNAKILRWACQERQTRKVVTYWYIGMLMLDVKIYLYEHVRRVQLGLLLKWAGWKSPTVNVKLLKWACWTLRYLYWPCWKSPTPNVKFLTWSFWQSLTYNIKLLTWACWKSPARNAWACPLW